jgi:hypothetical protein
MHQPDPFTPPTPGDGGNASPAFAAAALASQLARHGITRIDTATTKKFAVISVAGTLIVWTDGHLLWCIHQSQRRAWPAAHAEAAAARLAALARAAAGP